MYWILLILEYIHSIDTTNFDNEVIMSSYFLFSKNLINVYWND